MSSDEPRYTYWFIYLIPEYLQIKYITDLIEQEGPQLYAYTDKKELIHLWKEQRNSKIFLIKKKKITKGDVHFITDNYRNYFLQLLEGKTRTTDGETRHYKLAVTIREKLSVETDTAFMMHTHIRRNRKWLPSYVYIPIIQEALSALLYDAELFPNEVIPNECYEMLEDYDYLFYFIRKYQPLLK